MFKENRRLMALIITILSVIAIATSCKDNGTDSTQIKTGQLTVRLVWEDANDSSIAETLNGTLNSMPSTVVTIRFSASASDMTTMQQDFTASTGSGTINSIPIGSNRTLTVYGLDSSGATLYEGSATGINVQENIIASAGTITMTAVSSGSIPTSGLIAYYPFNGNANDESANSNNGTVNGATLTTDRDGNANSAYSFDGVDDWIEIDSVANEVSGVGTGTISIWFKSNSSSYNGSLIWFDDDGSAYGSSFAVGGFSSYMDLTESIGFFRISYLVMSYRNGRGFYFDNQWHHMVFTISENSNKLYVDGISLTSDYYNGNQTTGNCLWGNITQIRIGKKPIASTNVLQGEIDDIRIYNRALTSDEITALYNE
jgi:concanavalin A-like lectin/glucanase superfamily protein